MTQNEDVSIKTNIKFNVQNEIDISELFIIEFVAGSRAEKMSVNIRT